MSAESKVAAPKGGVDVLAAIEDSINECNDVTCPQCRRLAKARAAVAELIAASKTLLEEWDRQDHGRFDGMTAKDFFAAEARFRAALSNIEGGK